MIKSKSLILYLIPWVVLLWGVHLFAQEGSNPFIANNHAIAIEPELGFGLGGGMADYTADGTTSDGTILQSKQKDAETFAYVYGGGLKVGYQYKYLLFGALVRYLRISMATFKYENPPSHADGDDPGTLFGEERDKGYMFYYGPMVAYSLPEAPVRIYASFSPVTQLKLDRSNGPELKYKGWAINMGGDYFIPGLFIVELTASFNKYEKVNDSKFPVTTTYRQLTIEEREFSMNKFYVYVSYPIPVPFF